MTLEDVFSGSWLAFWRAMRAYHRYTVEGFEHIAEKGPALIVGYHARGFAVDLCILSVEMKERLGYLPHAIFHDALGKLPVFPTLLRSIGGVTGDGPSLEDAVSRGEHLIVLPGGGREAFKPVCGGGRVDWGDRTGYLRLALRLNLPIIPVVSGGADHLYVGFNDGYETGKKLGMPLRLPLWAGFGPFGIYPLSLPWPVQLRQIVGKRIALDAVGHVDPENRADVAALHRHVVMRMQALLNRANGASEAPVYERSGAHA
jgi:1-acyl-sn-glycerol-3-phosphate acyltransferase